MLFGINVFIDNNYNGCIEDTPILTSRYVNKNIQDVNIGEMLIGYDEYEKKIKETRVVEKYINKTDSIMKIWFHDKTIIQCTEDQPFFVYGKWIEANNLYISCKISSINIIKHSLGYDKKITYMEKINKKEKVYNFYCYPYENYFSNFVLSTSK